MPKEEAAAANQQPAYVVGKKNIQNNNTETTIDE
jgi:hypothetical protein